MMEELKWKAGERISARLSDFKWMKSRSQLIRKTTTGWQALVIDVLPTSQPGICKLVAHAQVRLERVEGIYTPLHPFLPAKDVKNHPTLTINCDHLISDRSLIHGFECDSIDEFSDRYSEAVQADVRPWLDKLSDEQHLYDGLIDPDPLKWVTSDRLVRFPVLLAILADRSEWLKFDEVLREFHEWCAQPHATVYKPLAEAMGSLKKQLR